MAELGGGEGLVIVRGERERHVQDVHHGDHLCLAFADDAEQRRVVSRYLSDGLERGERVLYFAHRLTPPTVLDWLRSAGVDPRPAVARGQLQVVTAEESYLSAGYFDADTMITTLRREVSESLASGYPGVRISGDMSWALEEVPGADQLLKYESRVDEVFAGHSASAICQYDARLFPPDRLDAADRCHPGVVELKALYADSMLRIVPDFRAGQRALRVEGTVDYRTTGALAAALATTLEWPGDVPVDMSGLEFIDVNGIRTLVHAARRLPAGRHLHIVDLAPRLCQVIQLVGWDNEPSLTVTAWEEQP